MEVLVILVNAKNEVTITKNISRVADLWSIERVKAAKGSSQGSRVRRVDTQDTGGWGESETLSH